MSTHETILTFLPSVFTEHCLRVNKNVQMQLPCDNSFLACNPRDWHFELATSIISTVIWSFKKSQIIMFWLFMYCSVLSRWLHRMNLFTARVAVKYICYVCVFCRKETESVLSEKVLVHFTTTLMVWTKVWLRLEPRLWCGGWWTCMEWPLKWVPTVVLWMVDLYGMAVSI